MKIGFPYHIVAVYFVQCRKGCIRDLNYRDVSEITAHIHHLDHLEIQDILDANVRLVDGGIFVKVIFINESSAVGCFTVVQSAQNRPDQYRMLTRNGTIASDIISVPLDGTGYTVLVYDIEQNGLPSTMPAIKVNKNTTEIGTYVHIYI